MEFIVLSKENAENFSYRVKKDCVFISITNPSFSDASLLLRNPHIKDVLRLKFDDTDDNLFNMKPMSQSQAKEIVEFVNKWKDEVELIVVHCEAGVSRSAGVCAAIMKYITNDDMAIFNNAYFCPNMFCYRLVLNEFFGSFDNEEATMKEEINIAAWKEKNQID